MKCIIVHVYVITIVIMCDSMLYFSDPAEVSVLVPGAGLGRLAYEVAKAGYICQGNEFSLFMLFASHFVLNRYVSARDLHC